MKVISVTFKNMSNKFFKRKLFLLKKKQAIAQRHSFTIFKITSGFDYILFYNSFNFYWFVVDFTVCILITLISPATWVQPLPLKPFPQYKTKLKRKTNNQTNQINKITKKKPKQQ